MPQLDLWRAALERAAPPSDRPRRAPGWASAYLEHLTQAPGYAGDVTVFELDALSWDRDVFIEDLPSGGGRLRRPAGGYRATAVAGVLTQQGGELTGATPGRVLDASVKAPAA